MHLRSTILAVATRAITGIAVWLLCAIPVFGGSTQRSAADEATERARITQTFSLRKLVRQAQYVHGPLAKRLKRALRDLKTGTNRVGRSCRVTVHDDDQAIQNDTAVTEITDGVRPALQPLGLFIYSSSKRAFTPFFPRRSPRGPPVAFS